MTRIEEIEARIAGTIPTLFPGDYTTDVTYLLSEVKRMREALELIASYCDGGFIKCERCGDQTDMTDCDMHIEARAALKSKE